MESAKRSVIVAAVKSGDGWRLRIRNRENEWDADVTNEDYIVMRLEEKIILKHHLPEELVRTYRSALYDLYEKDRSMEDGNGIC